MSSNHPGGQWVNGCKNPGYHAIGDCAGPTYSDGAVEAELVDAAMHKGDTFRVVLFAPVSGTWMWDLDPAAADELHKFLGAPAATDGIGQRPHPRHGETAP